MPAAFGPLLDAILGPDNCPAPSTHTPRDAALAHAHARTHDAGKPRKRTEEGYAIYREDELGMGKKGGGDTALCPFDCDCCF